MKQVCDILGELEPTLPATSVPEGAGEQAVLGAKQCLLELWHHLMESAERLAPGEIGPVVFNAVLGVMRRPEFDVSHLHLDVHMRPTCEVHDVMLAFRYRRLLFATMAYIARVLTVASDPSALAASTPEIPAKSPPGAGGGEKKTGPQLSPPPDRWAREVIRAATVKTIPEDAADLEVLDVVEVKTGVDGNPETPATATTTTTKRNPEGPPPLEVPEQRPVIIDEVAKIKAKTGEDETPSASATAPAAAAKMKAVTADEVDEPPAVAEAAAASLLFTPMKRYAPRGSNLSSNFVTFASKALAILFFRLPRKWFTFLLHPLSLSLSLSFFLSGKLERSGEASDCLFLALGRNEHEIITGSAEEENGNCSSCESGRNRLNESYRRIAGALDLQNAPRAPVERYGIRRSARHHYRTGFRVQDQSDPALSATSLDPEHRMLGGGRDEDPKQVERDIRDTGSRDESDGDITWERVE